MMVKGRADYDGQENRCPRKGIHGKDWRTLGARRKERDRKKTLSAHNTRLNEVVAPEWCCPYRRILEDTCTRSYRKDTYTYTLLSIASQSGRERWTQVEEEEECE